MMKIEKDNIEFKTIKESATAEIIEKKSKFIANIFYVESIEEAEKHIKEIKKKYNDAKHNCFAYAIEAENNGIIIKYNDDGEPAQTAGAPILKLILEQGLSNILVVVTRYFGGILLGTGGLVKAYTEATEKALKNSKIIKKTRGYEIKIVIEYNYLEPLKYYLDKENIKISKIEYMEKIELIIEISKKMFTEFEENKKNSNFEIEKYETTKEKFVEI